MNGLVLLPVLVVVALLWTLTGMASAQELVVYRAVENDGVVSFSDRPAARATPHVVQTYHPNEYAVESAADRAASAAELADQLEEQRLQREAMIAAVREQSRAQSQSIPSASAQPSDAFPGQVNLGHLNQGDDPRRYTDDVYTNNKRRRQHSRKPIETKVGTHFKAGWPGRLHAFGPVGSNQVETSE